MTTSTQPQILNSRELLISFVATHNIGVKTGSFDAMYQLLVDDAELQLGTAGNNRLQGKRDIAMAFEKGGSSNQIVVKNVKEDGDVASALYGWLGSHAGIVGTIWVEAEHGKVKRLVAEGE